MDVFDLQGQVVGRYASYVRSFFTIREKSTRDHVEGYLDSGSLWPDPLVQLNPSFYAGRTVQELARAGQLHPECGRIFQRGKEPDGLRGADLRLHWHQEQAIEAGLKGNNYVLTTGTGSGKSLAYFIPIVDHALRSGARNKRIKAIVVYPMNALANSQLGELEKFLKRGYPPNGEPVTFARYTGQEKPDDRRRIMDNPPDILLTNFMMLELILTRPGESELIDAAHGLEFLVLDELHTYRGRQGADVAMLVRRVRERCGATALRCIGTSATIAGAPTLEERQREVAELATKLFGASVAPENVIVERLQSAFDGTDPTPEELRSALAGAPGDYPADFGGFVKHPLAAWAEKAFGLSPDAKKRLERRPARTLQQVAGQLAKDTGVPTDRCAAHLRAILLAGYTILNPTTGMPLFAFRLHQIIGRGDRVFATLEKPGDPARHLTTEEQRFAPGDQKRRLYPLAFCRECGAEYVVATMTAKTGDLEPRELSEKSEDQQELPVGYLHVDGGDIPEIDELQVVEDWVEYDKNENPRVKTAKKKLLPKRVWVTPAGEIVAETAAEGATAAWWFPAPFRYCLRCQVTYQSERERDFGKLAELSTEGRSTSTTILSLTTVAALRETANLPKEARKLLSFTDNRQDASLQAGHFNDFVQVSLVRGALLAAIKAAGPDGLSHDDIAHRTFEHLNLDFGEYAADKTVKYGGETSTKEALKWELGYLLYNDLRRGWRVSSPNLEQVGLLKIAYPFLDELCANEADWVGAHEVLQKAKPAVRREAALAVLDFMRRELNIKVRYLELEELDRIKQRSEQWLREPWTFDRDQKLNIARPLILNKARPGDRRRVLGPNSTLGRYLRRGSTWAGVRNPGDPIPGVELGDLAKDLLDRLITAGLVMKTGSDEALEYWVQAGQMRWTLGDGTPPKDPVRAPGRGRQGAVNEFFRDFYETLALNLHGMLAHEHTAQVPPPERELREHDFGTAELPVLYCSPTMELGVDIKGLNAVHMRNAPPTPANYAQRSGRAGRSGQPALVITYCTNGSPHDQYYFKHRDELVGGQVQPPRIDLVNRDLIRAHVQAIWLAETGADLGKSVAELLQLNDVDKLEVQPGLLKRVSDPAARERAMSRAATVVDSLAGDLAASEWYSPGWLNAEMSYVSTRFNNALDRWRGLFRAAHDQAARQGEVILDHTKTSDEKAVAKRLREEAEAQLQLLINAKGEEFGDFYSYRYFASEGFLPGYNFPRLPLSAFLPGRQKSGKPNYLSRPRFLAVSEFGPRSIIYHEGSRFRVVRVLAGRKDRSDEKRIQSGKICQVCGYGHFGEDLSSDVCGHCGTRLEGTKVREFQTLMRLANVGTRRVDRITCDEEERLRIGYDVQTAYKYREQTAGQPQRQVVHFDAADGQRLAQGSYAHTATLWRVNLGWRSRKNKDEIGFHINLETGDWGKSDLEDSADADAGPDDKRAKIAQVAPFVEDRRNVFVLSPAADWLDQLLEDGEGAEEGQTAAGRRQALLASLQFALKRGVEACFQIEYNELAAEPLPAAADRREILFYEAAEGGAGVLSRLAGDKTALTEVAARALELCHFDASGKDIGRPGGGDECVAACYDCLLSYSNQPDHEILNRHLVKPALMALAKGVMKSTPAGLNPQEQYNQLLPHAKDEIEKKFLRRLYDRQLVLPSAAHRVITAAGAEPDFFYQQGQLCVYVDGDSPARVQRDADRQPVFEEQALTVVRFGSEESWDTLLEKHEAVFGAPPKGGA